VTEDFEPDLDLWDAWTPDQLAQRLRVVRSRWYVLAGWALDLFHGRQTRAHADLEMGVPRDAFAEIQDALHDCELFVVGDGRAWPISERTLAEHRQTWARERSTGVWRVDVIRETWDGDTWVCHRDERIRVPGSALILRTPDGIPFIRPDVALLFKAKHRRAKDEADFEGVLPVLGAARKAWLSEALERVHPGHPWLEHLRE
jgi:hypothetical protein